MSIGGSDLTEMSTIVEKVIGKLLEEAKFTEEELNLQDEEDWTSICEALNCVRFVRSEKSKE